MQHVETDDLLFRSSLSRHEDIRPFACSQPKLFSPFEPPCVRLRPYDNCTYLFAGYFWRIYLKKTSGWMTASLFSAEDMFEFLARTSCEDMGVWLHQLRQRKWIMRRVVRGVVCAIVEE